jgi:large subunit ribosomal protein L13
MQNTKTKKQQTKAKAQASNGWCLIDASGKTLGRLATQIAFKLRGKDKPEFTPHLDVGDYVIVINASKIKVTGNKTKDKMYYRHSGYTGHIKSIAFDKLLDQHPERIIKHAVKGMLPKGPLGRKILSKLKIYSGAEHPHFAQQPQLTETEKAKGGE